MPNIIKPIQFRTHNKIAWQSGLYGNKLRSWGVKTFLTLNPLPSFPVVLRYNALEGGGGFCVYNLSPQKVKNEVFHRICEGFDMPRIMVNEQAPDQNIILNGEFYNGILEPNHPYPMIYSTAKMQMRDALKTSPRHISGAYTRLLLKQIMTPSSWEDFQALLEQYPEHTIELSVYNCTLGDIPGRNTLIWECRRY